MKSNAFESAVTKSTVVLIFVVFNGSKITNIFKHTAGSTNRIGKTNLIVCFMLLVKHKKLAVNAKYAIGIKYNPTAEAWIPEKRINDNRIICFI